MKLCVYKKDSGGGGGGGRNVLAILMGGAKGFHLLKGGREKFYPVLSGGEARKTFWTCDFPNL